MSVLKRRRSLSPERPIDRGSIDDASQCIRKFDPKSIREYSTVLFAGGRRTGKSFMMRDIMYHLRKRFYDVTVVSGTKDMDHPWENYVPLKYVTYLMGENGDECIDEFPDYIIEAVQKRQEYRKGVAAEYGAVCPPSLIVLEDLEFLKHSMWNEQGLRRIMFNGRHPKTYLFTAIQYIMEIKMGVRLMFDYAVFMLEPSIECRNRIYRFFGGVFGDFDKFERVFKACTEDYKCMVVDLRPKKYEIPESVFWYRAKEHPPFHMGHRSIWDPEVDRRNTQIQGGSYKNIKGGLKIQLEDDDE